MIKNILDKTGIAGWKIRTKLVLFLLIMAVTCLFLYRFLWDHQKNVIGFLEDKKIVTWYDEEQFREDIVKAAGDYTVPESEKDEEGQKEIQPFLDQFADTYMGVYIYGLDDGLYRCGRPPGFYDRIAFGSLLGSSMERLGEQYSGVNAEFANGEYQIMYMSTHRILFAYPYVAVSTILCIALFLLVILGYISSVIKRISRVKDAIVEMAQGTLSHPVPPCGQDEVGIVASELDMLRKTLNENIRKESESRQANQDLITAMSHDLRTPLTVLNGYLEVLRLGRIPEDAQKEYIERCIGKASDIRELTDRMFEYALVYEENETAELTQIPAAVLIRCLEENCDFIRLAGFTVKTAFHGTDGTMLGDEIMIKRIFSNLFSNILKYGEKKKTVAINTEADRGRLKITLANDVKEEAGETESNQIGLRSVRKMVEQHRGELYTFSSARTYTVRITLPLSTH